MRELKTLNHSFFLQNMSQKVKNNRVEPDMNGTSKNTTQLHLAEDCAKEEHLVNKKRLSEFKPCKETLHYLSRNDVRPLKKVRFHFDLVYLVFHSLNPDI